VNDINPDIAVHRDRALKPTTADYANIPHDQWNVTTLRAFVSDKHAEVKGIPYAPFRGWGAESRMMRDALKQYGAKACADAYLTELRLYRPTPQYPGFSFGFAWSYKKEAFQRAYVAYMRDMAPRQSVSGTNDNTDTEGTVDWL
jgi:hypothetical protein